MKILLIDQLLVLFPTTTRKSYSFIQGPQDREVIEHLLSDTTAIIQWIDISERIVKRIFAGERSFNN